MGKSVLITSCPQLKPSTCEHNKLLSAQRTVVHVNTVLTLCMQAEPPLTVPSTVRGILHSKYMRYTGANINGELAIAWRLVVAWESMVTG